jgi:hypothetical protein
LLANRESVDLTSKWNDKVLEGVYRAFVWNAIPRFNKVRDDALESQSLRYTWPLFLKDRGGTIDFWSRLKGWIFNRLKTEDILESRQNGKLVNPKTLFYIPEEFRLENKPLVEGRQPAVSSVFSVRFGDHGYLANKIKKIKKK